MTETTPDAEASGGAAPDAADAPDLPEAPKPNEPLTVRALLEAGAHFGHQTGRWNPAMKPFIFGDRNGVHIIDLDQTLERFEVALGFLRELCSNGGKVLFVGTKRQAQAPIETEAKRAGQFYVNQRWLGGMLTNFRTVKRSIERYKQLLALVEDEEKSSEISKRELSRINRQIDKYRKSLDGIREMSRLPDALFVVDVNREHIAVTEARRLGIPIIAVVDTNCDPNGIDLVVPANDDAIRAIMLYCVRVADACAEGAALHQDKIVAEESARPPAGEKKTGPASGRKVVEITQQPRRGHQSDGESRGPRRPPRGGRKKEAAPEAAREAAPGAAKEAAPEAAQEAAPEAAAPAEGAASKASEAPTEGAGSQPAPTQSD